MKYLFATSIHYLIFASIAMLTYFYLPNYLHLFIGVFIGSMALSMQEILKDLLKEDS